MEKWSLPTGWQWLPVSTIAHDTERRNPQLRPHEYFEYIDIGSIDNSTGTIMEELVKRIIGESAPSRARKVIHVGDVLFATTRPYLRNISVVPELYNGQICSTGFCVLCPSEEVGISEYIYYAARSNFFIEQLIPKQRGANYPAVSDGDVFSTEIPIPFPNDPARSLLEQHYVVAKLKAVLAEVAEAHKLQEQIVADIKIVLQAALREIHDDLKLHYALKKLGDRSIVRIIPGQHVMSQYYSDLPPGTPYITGPADFGTKHPTITKWTTQPRVLCEPYDVLLTVKGSGVGKVNIAPLDQPTCISRQVMAIRPNLQELDTEYLYYILLGRFDEFQDLRQGAAIPGIKREQVEGIQVPLPPLPQQSKVVNYIRSMDDEIYEMKRTQDENTKLLGQLEQSLLAQAFRGEL